MNSSKQITVSSFTLFFAFRYALGRKSTAPSYVADDIKRNWYILSRSDKERIQQEIKEAIESNRAGMECDIKTWQEILNLKV